MWTLVTYLSDSLWRWLGASAYQSQAIGGLAALAAILVSSYWSRVSARNAQRPLVTVISASPSVAGIDRTLIGHAYESLAATRQSLPFNVDITLTNFGIGPAARIRLVRATVDGRPYRTTVAYTLLSAGERLDGSIAVYPHGRPTIMKVRFQYRDVTGKHHLTETFTLTYDGQAGQYQVGVPASFGQWLRLLALPRLAGWLKGDSEGATLVADREGPDPERGGECHKGWAARFGTC